MDSSEILIRKNTRFFFSIDYIIGELGFLLLDQSEVIVSGLGAPYKMFNMREGEGREIQTKPKQKNFLQVPYQENW